MFDKNGDLVEEIYELYDILNDPSEREDLKKEEPVILNQLKNKLRKWRIDALSFFESTNNQTQNSPMD